MQFCHCLKLTRLKKNLLRDAEYILFMDGGRYVRNGVQQARSSVIFLDKFIFGKALLQLLPAAVWKPATNDGKPVLLIFSEGPID